MKPLACLTLLLLTSCSLRRGLDADVCVRGSLSSSLAGLADSVSIFRSDTVVDSAGVTCGGAIDRAACEAEFSRLKPTEPRHMREHGSGPLTIILTRKDSVQRIDTKSTWAELSSFPPVARAQVWAEFRRGMAALCGGNNVAETAEGVRVLVSSHEGCFGGDDVLLLVKPDGGIETLKEKSYPQTCVG